MKNLIYKELKLAFHPVIYVFMFAMPLLILVPSYPTFVSFIYVAACYPILFLGANKGVQSNDIVYTTLLPVRKKDIVLARIISCAIITATFVVVSLIFLPFASNVIDAVIAQNPESATEILGAQGLPLEAYPSTIAFSLVGLSIFDFIFLPLFYRNGRGILAGTLIGMLALTSFLFIFLLILPLSIPSYAEFFGNPNIGFQLIVLASGLVIYLVMHFLIYKISSNLFEKVDL